MPEGVYCHCSEWRGQLGFLFIVGREAAFFWSPVMGCYAMTLPFHKPAWAHWFLKAISLSFPQATFLITLPLLGCRGAVQLDQLGSSTGKIYCINSKPAVCLTVLYHVDPFWGLPKRGVARTGSKPSGMEMTNGCMSPGFGLRRRTAEDCCICIPGFACVERFVTCGQWRGTRCQTVGHLERFMCNGTLGSASFASGCSPMGHRHVTVIVMHSALMPTRDAQRCSISAEYGQHRCHRDPRRLRLFVGCTCSLL